MFENGAPSGEGEKSKTKYAKFTAKVDDGKDSTTISPDLSDSKEEAPVVAGVGANAIKLKKNQVAGNKTKVKFIDTAEARKEFELNISGSITQNGQPFDTSKMYSKFMGDGFGIYVMGKDGKFYATSHKIGLFHHSSFLSGGDVAGAGEIKVVGGALQFITNKSGHYWPGDRELAQTLNELQSASGFSSAGLAQLLPNGGFRNPYEGGPPKFLEDHPIGVMGDNKEGIKYTGKATQVDKKERDDSVATVRHLIGTYVREAKLGKLKKFNKPNPDFGNTLEEIKQLVIAEFGWTEQDATAYEEVLKNWNNEKEIVEIPQGVPPPVVGGLSATSTVSPTDSTVSNVGGEDEKTPSGRDWQAEYDALIKQNPNPDFEGMGLDPYGGNFVIWRKDKSGYSTATLKQKVMLLKGEARIDDFRQ